MDYVLAKIKRVRKHPYKKLLSDITLYETLKYSDISMVKYNADHNLDEDSWFKVEKFSDQEFFLSDFANKIDSKDFDNLEKNEFQDITFLISLQDNDVYLQKVVRSAFINKKIICFGEVAKLEEGSCRIVVKSAPDAVYYRDKDTLLFRDLAAISSIFKGIDQLYKEATEEEVKAFLAEDYIKLSGAYDHSKVSKPNRKRLALVTDKLKNMPKPQRDTLIQYVKEYCNDGIKLSEDGMSFEISTDNQLKLVLYGLEERFYTTHNSKQKRLANSVEVLG